MVFLRVVMWTQRAGCKTLKLMRIYGRFFGSPIAGSHLLL